MDRGDFDRFGRTMKQGYDAKNNYPYFKYVNL